jgi:acetyl esterase/lipase
VVCLQDLPYGTNGNSLDLYQPHGEDGEPIAGNKPVLVFVYGGTWGSGDKSQYGLLCSQVADKLKTIVCCPNYSTYPKVSQSHRSLHYIIYVFFVCSCFLCRD